MQKVYFQSGLRKEKFEAVLPSQSSKLKDLKNIISQKLRIKPHLFSVEMNDKNFTDENEIIDTKELYQVNVMPQVKFYEFSVANAGGKFFISFLEENDLLEDLIEQVNYFLTQGLKEQFDTYDLYLISNNQSVLIDYQNKKKSAIGELFNEPQINLQIKLIHEVWTLKIIDNFLNNKDREIEINRNKTLLDLKEAISPNLKNFSFMIDGKQQQYYSFDERQVKESWFKFKNEKNDSISLINLSNQQQNFINSFSFILQSLFTLYFYQLISILLFLISSIFIPDTCVQDSKVQQRQFQKNKLQIQTILRDQFNSCKIQIIGIKSNCLKVSKIQTIFIQEVEIYNQLLQRLCAGGSLFEMVTKKDQFTEKEDQKYFYKSCKPFIAAATKGYIIEILNQNTCYSQIKPPISQQKSQVLMLGIFQIIINKKHSMARNKQNHRQKHLTIQLQKFQMEYDELSDVQSVGVILYILLAGTLNFNLTIDSDILNVVKSCKYRVDLPEFKEVSNDCNDMIQKSQTKFDQRLKAQQALNHCWLIPLEI
ncbi:unnamed protein product (macronuclear) [Paramecium tetraurelia]|uniref:Protein kinase domain-containing protein n=1 Tax=Paramecium tetraurelia TaxID=5888 RepID=A0BH61_PARTE|nr:uncharacterized protein GSPATT00028913001 [Paramecium tetraurelia]CAK57878.1 unnamed protein product [Paramecium tetraurelia]|eukprot:XP_001425276.1 hypothetical protein (macronuclear) [Paramecium tetraurelia strain d4-2]